MNCPKCGDELVLKSIDLINPDVHKWCCEKCGSAFPYTMTEGDDAYINYRIASMADEMSLDRRSWRSTWTAFGKPFAEVLDKMHLDNKPMQRMSVVEAMFSALLTRAIKAARERGDVEQPEALAAYITGFLAHTQMMPGAADDKQ